MNNKIIEFLSKREKCDIDVFCHNGSKKTYYDLLKEFPTENNSHAYLDSCRKHSYRAEYPNALDIVFLVPYNETELKERAREIALDSAKDEAQNTCMQKWRETQEAKKE